MIPTRSLLSAAFLIVEFGCHSPYLFSEFDETKYTPHRIAPRFVKINYLRHATAADFPDSGSYYLYRHRDPERIPAPDHILPDLYSRGFDVTLAWYRPPGSCTDPDSDGEYDSIHHAYFVVRLSTQDDAITLFHFIPIDRPKGLPCPFFVLVYAPNSR
jgi:hypothetical protein